MVSKILSKGAEADIIRKGKIIIKRRVKKSYRLSQIDERIRKSRTKSEAKLLTKAALVTSVPRLINVDESSKEISMEFINGKRVSESLDKFPLSKQKQICKTIGKNIGKLHDADIIHGDLTTSNMILSGLEVYLIDFGLGYISNRNEDKAVDLHLLKQALEAKHFEHWSQLFSSVLKGYSSSKKSVAVLQQFKKVEARGRYKENY